MHAGDLYIVTQPLNVFDRTRGSVGPAEVLSPDDVVMLQTATFDIVCILTKEGLRWAWFTNFLRRTKKAPQV